MRQVTAHTRALLQARLAERERIARELHDTLLQAVQALIWRFQAAAERLPAEDPTRQVLELSLDQADRLLGESRDKVCDLRAAENNAPDLAQALAAEGEQCARQRDSKVRVSVLGEQRELHPLVREEILLIGREALTNPFRHAEARIEAEVTYGKQALYVRIRDDGKGIERTVLAGAGRGCLRTTVSAGTQRRRRDTGSARLPMQGELMTLRPFYGLPEVLQHVQTQPLFVMRLNVRPLQVIGATPGAYRRVGVVPSGMFDGERLRGEVLEGGNDWQIVRGDGGTTLDVRLVLKTTDDALIAMNYRGIRHGPPDVIARLEKGEVVDPTSYYFRIAPLFETASPRYAWLNNVVGIGIGHRFADGPVYSVFEVL